MKPSSNPFLHISAAFAVSIVGPVQAASPYTWNSNGGPAYDGIWTGTNADAWNDITTPISGDTATITNGTVTTTDNNQQNGVALTIGASGVLNVDAVHYMYFNSTGSLALDAGTININHNYGYYFGWYDGSLSPTVNASSGSSFINGSGGLRLEGDTTFSGSGDLTISPGLHNWTDGYGNFGNTSITKSGSGTLTLSGANTYSGPTTVNAGILSLGNGTNNSNLNDSAAVTVGQVPASGAKIDLNFTGVDIVGSLTLNGTNAGTGFFDATSHPAYFNGTGQLFVAGAISDNDGIWDSSTDGYWGNSGNWASNTIASGIDKTATFNGALGTYVSLLTNITISNLAFAVEDYTLDGPSTLTLDASATPAISVATGRIATINANLGGFVGLEKSGAGSLLFSGVKSYTGGTTVTGGTLELNSSTLDQSAINGTLTVGSGATLKLTGLDFTGLGKEGPRVTTLEVDGGTVDNTVQSWVTGASVNLTGAMMSGGQYHVISSSFNSIASATTSIITTNLLIRKDYGSTDLSLDVGNGGAATDLLISGNIGQVLAVGVIKYGEGKLLLTGTNTYTGNTVVEAGTLEISTTSSLRFSPINSGVTNSVSGSATATLTFLGTVDLDLSATVAAGGNTWTLFDLGSFSGPAPTLTPTAVNSTLGSFTEGTPGTWELPVSGAKWVFTESNGQLAYIVTANDYDTWKTASGVTGGVNDDDDNDGLTNREEYAFGLIPNSGSSVNAIAVQLNKTTGTFSYQRRTQPLTGLTYKVWTSTDLATWSEDAGATASQTVTGTDGEVQTVQATITGTLPLTAPKLFIQVRAN